MKRAALSAESFSRMPPRCLGWLATMPTGRPPMRAKQVMIVRAKRGLMSNHWPSSTIRPITSYMSYGLRGESGRMSSSSSSMPVDRVRGLAQRRLLLAVRREERQVVLDRLDALLVGLDLEVADAGDLGVDLRAAELLLGHVLAGDRLGQVRPGQRHRAAALDHRHEVGQARDVGGARRARPHQRGDLRDDPAHRDLLAEQVARAGEQRAGRLLDPRAGGVEQPDATGSASRAPARAGA